MTADEFQKKYHDYAAPSRAEALEEIAAMEPVEGHFVIAVEFPPFGWALMLDTAAGALREMGIPPGAGGR